MIKEIIPTRSGIIAVVERAGEHQIEKELYWLRFKDDKFEWVKLPAIPAQTEK